MDMLDHPVISEPEPCDDCATGIMYFVCYDGVRRCRNCVRQHADDMGWNDPPAPPDSIPEPPPEPPPPSLPPTKSKVAKLVEESQRQQTFV